MGLLPNAEKQTAGGCVVLFVADAACTKVPCQFLVAALATFDACALSQIRFVNGNGRPPWYQLSWIQFHIETKVHVVTEVTPHVRVEKGALTVHASACACSFYARPKKVRFLWFERLAPALAVAQESLFFFFIERTNDPLEVSPRGSHKPRQLRTAPPPCNGHVE